LRWHLDLAEYDYEIIYRAGKDNAVADTLSRAYCASMTNNLLNDIHVSLYHSDVTRLHHYIKEKNLPYSLAEIRETSTLYNGVKEKPSFLKPMNPPLIKATQPLESLNIDFKGPLPSTMKN